MADFAAEPPLRGFEISPERAIRQGSRSFALASLFLPPSTRKDALLLYRWCRTCDDLIDEAPDSASALRSLERIESASPDADSILRTPTWVEPGHRSEFLTGFRMDLANTRYAAISDLELYCFRVAGVVGLMMCPVIGADPVRAPLHASSLGKAMQLTNIARDIQADAKMGRVYVPNELLPRIQAEDLAREPERALPAVRHLLELADRWYEEGLQGVAFLPFRTAFAIAIAGMVYREIGHELLKTAKKDPKQAFRRRTIVSTARKLSLLIPALLLVLRVKTASLLERGPRSAPRS
jgi:phytoene synthase